MDLSTWIPMFVALATLFGSVFVYANQKRLDRKHALGELRRAAYQELLVALQRQLHMNSRDSHADLSAARAKVFVLGSDRVVRATGRFFNNAVEENTNSSADGSSVLDAYSSMIMEMRRDSFEATSLSMNEIRAASPVAWNSATIAAAKK